MIHHRDRRLLAILRQYGIDLAKGRQMMLPPLKRPRGHPHKSAFHGFLQAFLVADRMRTLRKGKGRGKWKDLALYELSRDLHMRTNGRKSFERFHDRFGAATRQYARDVETFDGLLAAGKPIPNDLLRRLAEFDSIAAAACSPPRFIWGPKKPQ